MVVVVVDAHATILTVACSFLPLNQTLWTPVGFSLLLWNADINIFIFFIAFNSTNSFVSTIFKIIIIWILMIEVDYVVHKVIVYTIIVFVYQIVNILVWFFLNINIH